MFLLNWSSIYKAHIRSSLKIIFISSIGLIFAVGVIAIGLIYIDSIQQTAYNLAINNENINYSNPERNGIIHYTSQFPDINVNIELSGSVQNFIQLQESLNQTIYNRISMMDLNTKVSSVQIIRYVSGPMLDINSSYSSFQSGKTVYKYIYQNHTVNYICEMTPIIRKELQVLTTNEGSGVVPHIENNTEAYLFYFQDFNGNNNLSPDLNKPTKLFAGVSPPNSTLRAPSLSFINITGFAGVKQLDYTFYPNLSTMLLNLNVGFIYGYGDFVLFVNNLTQLYNNMVSNIYNYSTNGFSIGNFQNIILSKITLNYHNFNAFEAQNDLTIINQFTTGLNDDILTLLSNLGLLQGSPPSEQFATVSVYFNYYSSPLVAVIYEVTNILPSLVLFLFPTSIVTLFIANFSFGVVHRQILRTQ